MAIYGVGAYHDDHDVSQGFIARSLAGVGWSEEEAPELHRFIAPLKVGDIIYIKAAPLASSDIIVRAIGFVSDNTLLNAESSEGLVQLVVG